MHENKVAVSLFWIFVVREYISVLLPRVFREAREIYAIKKVSQKNTLET